MRKLILLGYFIFSSCFNYANAYKNKSNQEIEKFFKSSFAKAVVQESISKGNLRISSYVINPEDDSEDLEHNLEIRIKGDKKEFGVMNYLSSDQTEYLRAYPNAHVEVELYFDHPNASPHAFARAEVKGPTPIKITLCKSQSGWELILRPLSCPCPSLELNDSQHEEKEINIKEAMVKG